MAQQEVSKTMSVASSVMTPSSVLLSPTARQRPGQRGQGFSGRPGVHLHHRSSSFGRRK
jgi:hypothetical protein